MKLLEHWDMITLILPFNTDFKVLSYIPLVLQCVFTYFNVSGKIKITDLAINSLE